MIATGALASLPRSLSPTLTLSLSLLLPQPYGVGFNNYYGGRAGEVVAENRKRGVVVQAWSPLRKALKGRAREACAEIGKKYNKSAAQVGLRWIADANGGATFTTQTQSQAHFKEDLDIFDFKLTPDEIATLAAL